MKIIFRLKGGKGSGNYGHSGRPGEVGGSSEGNWTRHSSTHMSRQEGQYTVHVRTSPVTSTSPGSSSRRATTGWRAHITVEDSTLTPGNAHEPLRLERQLQQGPFKMDDLMKKAEEHLGYVKGQVQSHAPKPAATIKRARDMQPNHAYHAHSDIYAIDRQPLEAHPSHMAGERVRGHSIPAGDAFTFVNWQGRNNNEAHVIHNGKHVYVEPLYSEYIAEWEGHH